MMMAQKFKVLFLPSLFYFFCQVCIGQDLNIGSLSPGIHGYRWIKGDSITSLEKNHIYVLEFGFTTCAPCRESIPKLNKLALEYANDVTFISFYIWENGMYPTDTLDDSYLRQVYKFIGKVSSQINYNVAVDFPGQRMAKAWMDAAGRKEAPTVFVVNREGTIAWIGNPFDRMESVIDSAVARDSYIFSGVSEDREILVYHLIEQKRFGEALSLVDEIIESDPDKNFSYLLRFMILQRIDASIAYKYAHELLEDRLRDSEAVLTKLCGYVIAPPIVGIEPDYELGIEISKRALELNDVDILRPIIVKKMAYAYFKQGEVKTAVDLLTQEIAYLNSSKFHGYEEQIVTLEKQLEYIRTRM